MDTIKTGTIAILLFYHSLTHAAQNNMPSVFKSNIASIPKQIQSQMHEFTWQKGCPVSISDLAYKEVMQLNLAHQQ